MKKTVGKDWRGDSWGPVIGRAIERRLQLRRARLAQLLAIDPDDQEWRAHPSELPDSDGHTEVERYIAWRHAPATEGAPVYRLDLAIEELTGALRQCWALMRDVNLAPSLAQLHRNLEALEGDPNQLSTNFQRLDPRTMRAIENHYDGGWVALEANGPEPDKLLVAIRKAKASVGRPKAGRPKKSRDEAGRRLAEALAEIYQAYREQRPTRRVIPDSGGMEYGPFRDFVEEIMSVVPSRLRRTAKGGPKEVDHLVRIGVAHLQPRPRPKS